MISTDFILQSLKHVIPHVSSIFEALNTYKDKIITSINAKLVSHSLL
jgi:hypothetical protein